MIFRGSWGRSENWLEPKLKQFCTGDQLHKLQQKPWFTTFDFNSTNKFYPTLLATCCLFKPRGHKIDDKIDPKTILPTFYKYQTVST